MPKSHTLKKTTTSSLPYNKCGRTLIGEEEKHFHELYLAWLERQDYYSTCQDVAY